MFVLLVKLKLILDFFSGVVNNEKWEGVGGWAGLAGHTLVMEYDL